MCNIIYKYIMSNDSYSEYDHGKISKMLFLSVLETHLNGVDYNDIFNKINNDIDQCIDKIKDIVTCYAYYFIVKKINDCDVRILLEILTRLEAPNIVALPTKYQLLYYIFYLATLNIEDKQGRKHIRNMYI